MNGNTPSENYAFILTICIIALVLAVAWPVASATAFEETPGESGAIPVLPEGEGQRPTATNTPVPTATQPAVPDVGENEGGLNRPTPTRTSTGNGGASQPTATPDPALSAHERYNAVARNRIIFHAATPVQLCRVEEGLQMYFIGRKGDTRLGPWVPPFSELAELYPDGEEVSLFRGSNPLSGKRVKIDYLPSVNRIRVDTFYSDRDTDKNKSYIFHFGPEHDITYDVW